MPEIEKLSDLIDQLNEQLGRTFELSTGEVMKIPAPILWPDPMTNDDGEPVEKNDDFAARIVGEEHYKQFLADGGNWALLNRLLIDKAKAQQEPAGK